MKSRKIRMDQSLRRSPKKSLSSRQQEMHDVAEWLLGPKEDEKLRSFSKSPSDRDQPEFCSSEIYRSPRRIAASRQSVAEDAYSRQSFSGTVIKRSAGSELVSSLGALTQTFASRLKIPIRFWAHSVPVDLK